RSKLSVRLNVGRTTSWPSTTIGRSLTRPNEKPSGQVQVVSTESTPYLAGELISTAPPRYLTHSSGNQQGMRISVADSQRGSFVIRPLNSRHCLFVEASQVASSCSQAVSSSSDLVSASRIMS